VLGRLFWAGFFGLAPAPDDGAGGAGSDPDDGGTAADATEAGDGKRLVDWLVERSVLIETDGLDDRRLTEEFRSDWWRRIEQVRDDEQARLYLAMLIAVDPDEVSLEQQAKRFVATRQGTEIGAWPSRAAFLADVALYPTLEEWLPQWTSLDGEARGELLARLRTFLERCPVCASSVHALEDESITDDHVAVSITCTRCERVIVTGSY